MVQYYKVDNRLLNEEEYNEHCVGVWAVSLFFGGAILCGYFLHDIIPADWAKELRFGFLVVPSVISGLMVARFAGFVRGAFFLGLALAFVYGVASWIWSLI